MHVKLDENEGMSQEILCYEPSQPPQPWSVAEQISFVPSYSFPNRRVLGTIVILHIRLYVFQMR